MNIYDDIDVAKETDDDGDRYVIRLDGKRIIANTMRECLKAMDLIEQLPENCRAKTFDFVSARRRARRNRRKAEIAGIVAQPLTDDDIKLYHCRFQEIEVQPASVDLVFTDIPYVKEFLPEVEDLAKFAEQVLVDGGLFVSYVGQYYLPFYMETFGKYLEWGWLASTTWKKEAPIQHQRKCANLFNPLIVFYKGHWPDKGRWYDSHHAAEKEKSDHPWQKPLDDVAWWVRAFSDVGDLVCDPCAGSFTTAEACSSEHRRFIGCDCVEENVIRGQRRILNSQAVGVV